MGNEQVAMDEKEVRNTMDMTLALLAQLVLFYAFKRFG